MDFDHGGAAVADADHVTDDDVCRQCECVSDHHDAVLYNDHHMGLLLYHPAS